MRSDVEMLTQAHDWGDKIEDYEVQQLLGKGGFASVYKARCLKSNRLVAIKMIDKKLIQGNSMTNRVRQEVEIHSRLKHPAVLELFTFFQDSNYVYLVLELAHNGELQRYMKQHMGRVMTEAEAANVLNQVVAGILYLHSHNIMHRDISLSNLLLSQGMQVKIADFGLAAQLKRPDEKHMTMCGTPNYISPEVVARSSYGLPADVWGIGCMFYTLLVGRPPFDTDAVQSTLTKVVMSDYHLPAELSYEARDLIGKLLRKNPNKRITLEQMLTHPFMLRYQQPNMLMHKQSNFVIGSSENNQMGNNNCDSGIVTFASSNCSAPLQRSRSVDKFTVNKPLAQIYERAAFDNDYNNCYHNYNENKQQKQQQQSRAPSTHDSMDIEWQPPKANVQQQQKQVLNENCTYEQQMSHANAMKMIPGIPTAAKAHAKDAKTQHKQSLHVRPLNTLRLQATRYKTKSAIMSILRSGEVVIEFIKYKSHYNENRITDICWISSDGMRIIIYQPDPERGIAVRDDAPMLPIDGTHTDCIFNYDNLPAKHWKKYVYASRFVNLVKSKTPKVTYYSVQAKCCLMESMLDFECCFYTGAKVLVSSTAGVSVYDQHGRSIQDATELAMPAVRALLDHQHECFEHCQRLCHALETVENQQHETDKTTACFPATIGRRPLVQSTYGQVSRVGSAPVLRDNGNFCNSGHVYHHSTPKSQQGSFNFSVSSSLSSANSRPHYVQSVPDNVLAAQQNVPIKRFNVPGIGYGTVLSHGIVHVQFHDGSHIAVLPQSHGSGITYTQTNGLSTHFGAFDDLPLTVREKLLLLPQVEQQLKEASLFHPSYDDGSKQMSTPLTQKKLPVQKLITSNNSCNNNNNNNNMQIHNFTPTMKFFR